MVSLCAKFEVSKFTRYEAMNGGAKCRMQKMQKMGWFGVVRGHSRSTAMSPFDRAHTTSYSTLLSKQVYLYSARHRKSQLVDLLSYLLFGHLQGESCAGEMYA